MDFWCGESHYYGCKSGVCLRKSPVRVRPVAQKEGRGFLPSSFFGTQFVLTPQLIVKLFLMKMEIKNDIFAHKLVYIKKKQ